MNKANKIIICDNNTKAKDRVNKMMEAFKDHHTFRLITDKFQRNKLIQYYPEKKELTSFREHEFLIFLIHAGDKKYTNQINARLRVWYSGGGGGDTNMNSSYYRIKRKILDTDFLTTEEAQQLIEFAQGKIAKPSFIISPNYHEGIQVAFNIWQDLSGLVDLDNLENYDKKVAPFPYLHASWKKLKTSIIFLKKTKGDIPFQDTEYLKILNRFQDEINDIEEKL